VNIRRRLQQRFSHRPTTEKKSNLAWLGRYLKERNVNHFGRRSVAGAVGLGFFLAFIPIPVQMFLALPLALIFRVNLAVTMAATWISNPITLAPIIVLAYSSGCIILRLENAFVLENFEPSIAWFQTALQNIWLPLITGSVVCGLIAGTMGYAVVLWLWRVNLIRARRGRSGRM
jgi:hypothetical protein